MLQIYNSLSKQKEVFKPNKEGQVSIYVCGMTVYDYCHLGHARMLVAFDVITRYLRAAGYQVKYIRNITDVDDKIINRANEVDESWDTLAQRFIDYMHEDEKALNILPPDQEPRATEYIEKMTAMIQTLIDKGFAYQGGNNDVFFDVSKFEKYGQLAQKDVAGQQAGARVDVVDAKHHPLDFVLWKQAKPDEPHWDSPWGPGRPGWHIECSAMSTDCLGSNFDIHGGGFDLQFPHHENEIAQSEAATGECFANVWMHVGYLQVNKEKMSKSLANFFTVRDVMKEYSAEVIRYFLLSSHYRSQLNYSTENLDLARGAVDRFYTTLRGLPVVDAGDNSEFSERFHAAMQDDFNTPEALAVLFDMTHKINQLRQDDSEQAAQLAASLRQLGSVLGLLEYDPEQYFQGEVAQDDVQHIEQLIAQRNQAREDKAWADADKIREQLHAMGIEIEDDSEGTTWRRMDVKE